MTHRQDTAFSLEDRVATLIMARPEVRNAITSARMLNEMLGGIAEAESAASVLVITGEGSAFSAGGNIKDMKDRVGMFGGTADEIHEAYRKTIQRLTRAMAQTDLVTIAAVNGPAVGAGFDLVLWCDLRIGSTEASFAHTFVDLGIIPGDGGAWILPRVIGWQRAAELSFTGRVVQADEAKSLGVLLEVVSPNELMPTAQALAASIAAKPPHSVRLAKRLLRLARSSHLDEFLDLSAALQSIAHQTADHREAVEAFFAKRVGSFDGR